MSGTRIRVRTVTITAVLLLAGAGCGGSSAVTAPNTPKQLSADKALAKQAVLRQGDLPAGYTGTPHTDSGNNLPPAAEASFLACTHLPRSFLNNSANQQPNADAPDFKKGDITTGPSSEIDSSVELDRSSKDISDPLSHLQEASAAKCFEPFFQSEIEQGAKDTPGLSLTGLTVRDISIGSVGDQRAAFEGRLTLSASGLSIPTYFDIYFVRRGRAVVDLTGIGFRQPVSQVLVKSLLATMVGRLDAAT